MNSLRRVVLVLFGIGLAELGLAATFAVTNTNDSGDGSLRQAILDANMTPGADLIAFAIPGGGVHTITIESGLPTITDPVTIDGFTQLGASPNTNPPGQGFNTVIEIEIDCSGAAIDSCLPVAAGNTTVVEMRIQGLAINECFDSCIALLDGADGALITNNFIGTDPAGTVAVGDGHGDGIVVMPGFVAIVANLISGSYRGITAIAPNTIIKGNLIGTNAAGTSPIPNQIGIYDFGDTPQIGDGTAAGLNVISGNTDFGVLLVSDEAEIVGNLIGTDVSGTKPLGNYTGVGVQSLVTTIQGNVISANDLGVQALSVSATAVDLQSNFIGTDLTGTIDLGNRLVGVQILDQGSTSWNVGGVTPGSGNVIAHNRGLGGVAVASDETRVRIRGNRMFRNFPLGIDLVSGGEVVTANDTGDADDGPNHLQNFPLISSVVPGASATHIEGALNSTPSTSFDVDLYSTSCLAFPQDYLQGEEYLGSVQVTTDGIGNASFAADVPFVLTPDQQVTATATDPDGNTSEFSQRMVNLCFPAAGPSGGGTTAVLYGMLYDPLATVTVGGVPPTDVTVTSPTMLVATMPALPPGTRNDIVVTNPSGGLSGTLANGWISDFLDVPESHPFYLYVVILFRDDITAGAGGGNYGVDASTLRQQMAVFILKSKHGICYTPPPCTGVFADVPCANPFAPWIEAMASEGITGGCGGGNFCPQNPVRRDQMAVFLLKGEHGSSYVPPPCAGIFGDVPCPGPFADWIEELSAEEITGGCGGGNYCPLDPNTRGQMAVFLAKTFHLL